MPRYPENLVFKFLVLVALVPATSIFLECTKNQSINSHNFRKRPNYFRTSKVKRNAKINRISVYGERNSCTTMISRILENNFRLKCNGDGRCIGPWQMWKHDFFRQALMDVEFDSETLHVLVTRHPYEWLHSMWKRPHYADAHDNLDFDTFLKRQWRSYVDVRSQKRFSSANVKKLERRVFDNTSCVTLSDQVGKLSVPGSFCRFGTKNYFCNDVFGWNAQRGDYQVPNLNCISGHQSNLICSEGRYLCLVGTRVEIPTCSDDARRFLARVGGICAHNNSHYECVPDSDGADDHCGRRFPGLCSAGYVLCPYGTWRVNAGELYPPTSNRNSNKALIVPECAYLAHPGLADGRSSIMGEIGGMCRHDGRFFRCTVSPYGSAAAGDGRIPASGCLSGDESAAVCDDGGYLCEHDVRLDWDPPYVFMVPLMPCHPYARDAVRTPGGGCMFDGIVHVCRNLENQTVQRGTEPSPSPSCRNGAESWGLCDGGAFLCEEEPVAYPPENSRHGLDGQFVPRCDAWPRDALREIGALCRYLGRNYACVQFPGINAVAGDLRTPYVRCLSGDQSSRLCHHGKYLCEQGVNFDAFWAGGTSTAARPPECSLTAKEVLSASGACLFEGQRYSCEALRYHRVRTGLEKSPYSHCRSGAESIGLCTQGMFLCAEPPECSSEADSLKALARIGGSCRRGHLRYSCQDLRGKSLDLSNMSGLPIAGEVNLNGCLSFLKSLCPPNYALCSHRRASMEPYPHFSSLHGIPGITIPPCENGTHELKEVGGQCVHMGKSYLCIPFAGHEARLHEETSPSEHCLSGHESIYMCSFGRYLCESLHVHKSRTQMITTWEQFGSLPSSFDAISERFSSFFRSMQPSLYQEISPEAVNLGECDVDSAVSGAIEAEISNVSYPQNSSRFGIPGIFVPACVEVPDDELSKIGSICHHDGEYYGCIIVPGTTASRHVLESPHKFCFSGHFSSRICKNGKYLCKDGYLFPWLFDHDADTSSKSTCLLQCGMQARLALSLNQTCLFEGLQYRCEEIPQFRVESGLETSPYGRCRSATESWGLCSDGKFLCVSDTRAEPGSEKPCWEKTCSNDCLNEASTRLTSENRLAMENPVDLGRELNMNFTHLELLKPLPCELAIPMFLNKPDDVCIYERKTYQCKLFTEQQGLEPRPIEACKSGKESWGLCESGKFLCEEPQYPYPIGSMRHGIPGQYVPRCDAFPVDELAEIGGLCRYRNRTYQCIHVPGKAGKITGPSHAVRCFSNSLSSVLCTNGKVLCDSEDSETLPWLCSKINGNWTGSESGLRGSKCPLLCGKATRESLAQEGSCNSDGKKYRCEHLSNHLANVGVESPASRCASGNVSAILCPNSTFLCTEPPNCLKTEESALALRETSGVCVYNSKYYMCHVTSDLESFNSSTSTQLNSLDALFNDSDCLQSISNLVCYPGHVLCSIMIPSVEKYPVSTNRYEIAEMTVPRCSEVTNEMHEIGSICKHLGRKYKCVSIVGRAAFRTELESPSQWCLSGKESAPLCAAGKYLCQDWIQQPWQVSFLNSNEFPSCIMPMLESIRAAASSCSFRGKVYSCRLITGTYVNTGLERGPGEICRNGAESWNFCSDGKFLCETIPSCSGAGGFALADLGGVCWSSLGLHQCLKAEYFHGVQDFNSSLACHSNMFPGIICNEDEILCMVNNSVKVPQQFPVEVQDSSITCPLDDMMRLRMVGGVCQLAEKKYECRSIQDFTRGTLSDCSNLSSDLRSSFSALCPKDHFLCPSLVPDINSSEGTQAESQQTILNIDSSTNLSLIPCHGSNRGFLKAPGSVCFLDGKRFKCKSIPGLVAAEFEFQAPYDGCKSGAESILLCTHGRFLCEVDQHYRWEQDTFETYLASFEEPKDRNPDTHKRFPNIMAMRTAKLKDWMLYSSSKNHSYHISCRDFLLNPEEVLGDIEAKFSLDRLNKSWSLDTCIWRFGVCQQDVDHSWNSPANVAKRRYYQDGGHLRHFTDSNFDAISKSLDPAVEAVFGYRIFRKQREAQILYDENSRCFVHWPSQMVWSRRKLCSTRILLYRLALLGIQNLTAPLRGLWMLVQRAGKSISQAILRMFSHH